MTGVFLDTSAIFAVLDRDDLNHVSAKQQWLNLVEEEVKMVCTNYILLESFALIQNRLGFKALHVFQEDILPVIQIVWIDEKVHAAGTSALFQASKRKLSFVDCVSFIIMRSLGIRRVFTFDRDFKREGFDCLGVL